MLLCLFSPGWFLESWLQRDDLFLVSCKAVGTAGLQEATDWNIRCCCSFWLGVPSFVPCVQILLAQPRCYLFNRGFAGHRDSHLPHIFKMRHYTGEQNVFLWHSHPWDRLSNAYNVLLSIVSFPNIPPFAWCGSKSFGLRPTWLVQIPVLPLTLWHWENDFPFMIFSVLISEKQDNNSFLRVLNEPEQNLAHGTDSVNIHFMSSERFLRSKLESPWNSNAR